MSDASGLPAPSADALTAARAALAPWRALTSPIVLGEEHLPASGPAMFVGNHTAIGVWDTPLLVLEVHDRTGVLLRGMGDRAHFALPGWRELLTALGTVPGSREACRRLLADGESVLVFPGGATEITKAKRDRYRLLWGRRTGFARLAREAGVPIHPFAMVGGEEFYEPIVDGDSRLLAPVRRVARAVTGRNDLVPPIPRGFGPTLLPRPQRLYFAFGPPVATAGRRRHRSPEDADRSLRDDVRAAVHEQIMLALEHREADPQRGLLARLAGGLRPGGEP